MKQKPLQLLISVSSYYLVTPCKLCQLIQFSTIMHTIENEITPQKFTLSSFELWFQQLNLSPMEKADLQKLIGKNVGAYVCLS